MYINLKINEDGTGYLLTNKNGETFNLSTFEFWELCRMGTEIDTRSEVEEYLSQCPEINNVDLARIRAFPKLVDTVAQMVISDRINNENGDQIYYAAEQCIKKHIANLEADVKWFRLSDDKCISVWYAPDNFDGDQFQMHLEEIGDDGVLGPSCEVLSDESYATADISRKSLCETLSEIYDDAKLEASDEQITNLADAISISFGLLRPSLETAPFTLLSVEDCYDSDFGASIVQYMRKDGAVSFAFSDVEVDEALSNPGLVLKELLTEQTNKELPLWSNLSANMRELITDSMFDMHFVDFDNEDWTQEMADIILEEAVDHGLDNYVTCVEPDCYVTVFAGAMGAVDWSGHEKYGKPCLECVFEDLSKEPLNEQIVSASKNSKNITNQEIIPDFHR